MRSGAGFLPLRLPVARRSRPGYRIYSATDFLNGRDCEPAAATEFARRAPGRRATVGLAPSIASAAVLVAAGGLVAGVIVAASWHRAIRSSAGVRARVSQSASASRKLQTLTERAREARGSLRSPRPSDQTAETPRMHARASSMSSQRSESIARTSRAAQRRSAPRPAPPRVELAAAPSRGVSIPAHERAAPVLAKARVEFGFES